MPACNPDRLAKTGGSKRKKKMAVGYLPPVGRPLGRVGSPQGETWGYRHFVLAGARGRAP